MVISAEVAVSSHTVIENGQVRGAFFGSQEGDSPHPKNTKNALPELHHHHHHDGQKRQDEAIGFSLLLMVSR